MVKHTAETLAAICDRLVAHPYLKPAARAVGINPSTLFAWLEKSRSDPSSLTFMWSGLEAPFHQHVGAAMRMSVLLIESRAREMALNGFDEVVTFQGQVQYELDPRYVGVDDATMVKLGLDKPSVDYHRYKRDAEGQAIPLKVKRKPSDALVTTVLRAHFRKLYGEHKSVSVGGGVLVVGGAQEMAPATAIDHREPKRPEYLEMTPIEASEEEEARRGGFMVVGTRAKTSAEIEEREREYLSKTVVIEFVESEGNGQPAAGTGDNGPPNPNCSEGPVAASAPAAGAKSGALATPGEQRPTATPATPNRPSGIGYGKPPPGGYKVC